MSRYTITVTGHGKTDPDAVIGYDPPLGTFFLQAFPDENGEDLALWLGTELGEFRSLEKLRQAAMKLGYDFVPLPSDLHAKLTAEIADASRRPGQQGPLADFLKHLRKTD